MLQYGSENMGAASLVGRTSNSMIRQQPHIPKNIKFSTIGTVCLTSQKECLMNSRCRMSPYGLENVGGCLLGGKDLLQHDKTTALHSKGQYDLYYWYGLAYIPERMFDE
ncbi:hypothetical protein J6590_046558 [Homalodisca vitripennis]|nr:hypothetical protein J6590_046558 [Homalodisca vitripennis]